MAMWAWIVTLTVWVLFTVAVVWLIQHLYDRGGAGRNRGNALDPSPGDNQAEEI
jgi:hypothetical protein